MRFEVTRALDAIERRIFTDPLRTGGIVDVAEIIRLVDLDGGKPISLMRLGMVIDGLAKLLGDGGAALYPVASRALLSDTALTSNERMVLRRWSDDGLVEILPQGIPPLARAGEISALTAQPVVTATPMRGYTLRPIAEGGGAMLLQAGPPAAPAGSHPALSRLWRCPEMDCPSFGRPGVSQSPPHLAQGGVPTCPRHLVRLGDAGARPPVVMLVARVDGLVRHRFGVAAGSPVIVGRNPDERGGVVLGPYLDERAAGWISRKHVRLELRADGIYATDLSTNGTIAVGGGTRNRLPQGQPHRLGDRESLELHEGVEVTRYGAVSSTAAAPRSVMTEAPTVAIRLPKL
ncbi:hypothetical protein Val02_67250 [Virgisporangium aliadipatigenens]|uniref:FHA domain-containing protein n=1 Tax=Virgisporangium aliadipatigenens TaxID=741659 RepID=A0A8J4DTJ8_9ACTN|nr:FHA domain-containing protein [Virgisporangium aliadipatigenens]GIJ49839.1 hypothetical protein Val02_67250 [Virgisporangium aliadipatigenens]